MVFFITFLRALAACLITNAHYTGIYPTDMIANGGLVGDVLFFSVSGYCLYNVKPNFLKWYGKRLWRVYPPVWIATAVCLLVGGYVFADMAWYQWFAYPTYYHFVASIILLYVPYYLIMRVDALRKRIPLVMLFFAVVMLLIYVFWYDTSYYHIDTVREPFIRFLFMESMLLGAYFKQNDHRYRNRFSVVHLFLTAACFGAYFVSKLLFSKMGINTDLQIFNQVLIFLLLYMLFRTFSGLDGKLEKLPRIIKVCIAFLAEMTLEIYVVQYVLIETLRPVFGFPLNWIVITASILAAAFALHMICKWLYRVFDWSFRKIKLMEKKV